MDRAVRLSTRSRLGRSWPTSAFVGSTQGDVAGTLTTSSTCSRWKHRLRIDIETTLQRCVVEHGWLLTAANWVYIWLHWPCSRGRSSWLLVAHRYRYLELRNAIFVSGAIGMVIYDPAHGAAAAVLAGVHRAP